MGVFAWIKGVFTVATDAQHIQRELDSTKTRLKDVEEKLHKMELENASNKAALNIVMSAAHVSFPQREEGEKK